MALNIEELIKRLGDRFIAENAEGVDAVIQFQLEGEQSGKWYLLIKDQKCNVVEGVHANPVLSVSADSQDLKDVLGGKTSLMKALMSGVVKVQGDITQAIFLIELFRQD